MRNEFFEWHLFSIFIIKYKLKKWNSNVVSNSYICSYNKNAILMIIYPTDIMSSLSLQKLVIIKMSKNSDLENIKISSEKEIFDEPIRGAGFIMSKSLFFALLMASLYIFKGNFSHSVSKLSIIDFIIPNFAKYDILGVNITFESFKWFHQTVILSLNNVTYLKREKNGKIPILLSEPLNRTIFLNGNDNQKLLLFHVNSKEDSHRLLYIERMGNVMNDISFVVEYISDYNLFITLLSSFILSVMIMSYFFKFTHSDFSCIFNGIISLIYLSPFLLINITEKYVPKANIIIIIRYALESYQLYLLPLLFSYSLNIPIHLLSDASKLMGISNFVFMNVLSFNNGIFEEPIMYDNMKVFGKVLYYNSIIHIILLIFFCLFFYPHSKTQKQLYYSLVILSMIRISHFAYKLINDVAENFINRNLIFRTNESLSVAFSACCILMISQTSRKSIDFSYYSQI